ncbi:unnamed protein product [Adineta steineri]|uniref:Uncharacterized protein n=1 Tax=Adineta steineri TaxID=433720 RepID=A0A813M5D3_9BILA|nr:unnamed protein product [Adineta steineri]CAF0729856.1 unnamed protein product [Adineta steineri]CAF3991443.1 unnamed protein product [Adineta steineri]CAF4040588.1 unnamed protein product [Adineta steineri]
MTHARRYRIKDVSVAYHHLFIVSDDEDKTVYIFHYQYDKLGHTLILMDSSGTVLMNIRQISQIHITFDIYAVDDNEHHNNLLGVVRRRGPPWHHKYIIESVYGEYTIDRTGKLHSHEYKLMQDQQSIAKIHQEDQESDHLASIEIAEDVDKKKDPFILTLVMIQLSL